MAVRNVNWALVKQIGVAGVTAAFVFGIIAYGLHGRPTTPAYGEDARLQLGQPMTFTLDASQATCTSPAVLLGIKDQVARNDTRRIIGLSDTGSLSAEREGRNDAGTGEPRFRLPDDRLHGPASRTRAHDVGGGGDRALGAGRSLCDAAIGALPRTPPEDVVL